MASGQWYLQWHIIAVTLLRTNGEKIIHCNTSRSLFQIQIQGSLVNRLFSLI